MVTERTEPTSTDTTGMVLLRPTEVARRLSLGKATVYEMIAAGELPVFRRGRSVRVPAKALEDWLERRIILPAV